MRQLCRGILPLEVPSWWASVRLRWCELVEVCGEEMGRVVEFRRMMYEMLAHVHLALVPLF